MIAIDLGSNTIRFIEFDGTSWGAGFEKIVRTAEGLHQNGMIGDAAVNRILDAIQEASGIVDLAHQEVRACATAAMRLASNRDAVLDAIERACGIRFRIISADEEAMLTLKAVRYRLERLGAIGSGFILSDIGGGSTELITSAEGKSRSVSLDVGIVTLSERSETADDLCRAIDTFKASVRSLGLPPLPLVLTAGTPTTIAAYLCCMEYDTYDATRINGFRLSRSQCYQVYEELLAMSETQRRRYVGVGRENLIIAGILMVTSIYEALGCEEAVVVDDGLREGIALAHFD